MPVETLSARKIETHRITRWIVAYAIAYALLHITPVFLTRPVWGLMTLGDVVDFFTPFLLCLLVYAIYRVLIAEAVSEKSPLFRYRITGLMLIGGVMFVEGHGIHLAGNAIGRYLSPDISPALYGLVYFFDEIWGHILWDGGLLLFSIGMILMAREVEFHSRSLIDVVWTALAGQWYGFTFFVNAVEGQTVFFTFPLAILIPVYVWQSVVRKRRSLFRNPVLTFFVIAYLVADLLFVIWYLWHRGFPEFSELGWI